MFWYVVFLTLAFLVVYGFAGFITTLSQEFKIDGYFPTPVFRGMMLIWPYIFVRGFGRVSKRVLDSMVTTKFFAVREAWKAVK